MNSAMGYNAQRVDPVTGFYHLGNGYRVYDPQHQAFYQSDSLSPFGDGGMNDRAYCAGQDPVNWHDPSGHIMVSRREQVQALASLDDMIRESTPIQRDPAAWWQYARVAYGFMLAVGLSVMTGGLAGALILAVAMAATALSVVALTVQHTNPLLSAKLDLAATIVGFLDGFTGAAKTAGRKVMSTLARGVRQLRSVLTKARLNNLMQSVKGMKIFGGQSTRAWTYGDKHKLFTYQSGFLQKRTQGTHTQQTNWYTEPVIENGQVRYLYGADTEIVGRDIQQPLTTIARRNSTSSIYIESGVHGRGDGDNWLDPQMPGQAASRNPMEDWYPFLWEDMNFYMHARNAPTAFNHPLGTKCFVDPRGIATYNRQQGLVGTGIAADYYAVNTNLSQRNIHIIDMRSIDAAALHARESGKMHVISGFCFGRNDERWLSVYNLPPVVSYTP